MIEDKVHKSKFGWGVFLFLAAMFIITSWLSYDSTRDLIGSLAMLIVPVVILGSFTTMSLITKYTIKATELHIKCLPFYNKKISINSIRKVAVSRNLISSPAPSLDRIEVYYNKYDSIVISPKNKFQFMEDLKQLNPAIELIQSH